MTAKELDEWESEGNNYPLFHCSGYLAACSGDRVQWFRAEAEVQRWLEQLERRHGDFMRCIKYFGKMKEVWRNLAVSQPTPGHSAYALERSAVYHRMEINCRQLYKDVAEPMLLNLKEGQTLAQAVMDFRVKEGVFCELVVPKVSDAFKTLRIFIDCYSQ